MSRWVVPARNWFLVLIWMAIIFTASSDAGSSQRTSRIIGPIVHWLYPQTPEAELDRIIFGVRKAAHVTEYAILAVLVRRALQAGQPAGRSEAAPAGVGTLGKAWLMAAAYAATDEFHQTFVPTRTGCWQDVVIDSAGAAVGLALVWLWDWVRARARDGKTSLGTMS